MHRTHAPPQPVQQHQHGPGRAALLPIPSQLTRLPTGGTLPRLPSRPGRCVPALAPLPSPARRISADGVHAAASLNGFTKGAPWLPYLITEKVRAARRVGFFT
jgi:hypothetical protein